MPDQIDEVGRLKAELDALTLRVRALEDRSLTSSQVPSRQKSEDVAGWRLRTVNRVGAFTVVLGVLFFLKYAVDENLMGPLAGIWFALLFGSGFLLAGEWFHRRSLPAVAQGITGTGVAVVFSAVYAANAYYKLIGAGTGFAGLCFVCLGSVLLSFRYANSAVAFLGFLGAVWTPVLLSRSSPNAAATLTYFLAVLAASSFVGQRLRWVALTPTMAALICLCSGITFGRGNIGWLLMLAATSAIAYFAIARASHDGGKGKAAFSIAGHLTLLTAGGCFIHLSTRADSVRSELDSVLLACYGIALLLVGSLRGAALDKGIGSVLLGVVIVKLYLVDIWTLARIYRVSAFVGLGALLLIASYLYSRSDRSKASA